MNGKITSPILAQPVLADIQQLNTWAYAQRYPVTKVSLFCLGNITKDYFLLPSGAAIGPFGPKLIAKTAFSLEDLNKKTIAIPGLDTTAYLLFRALFGPARKVRACRYDEIVSLVLKGEADAGLIIHETRFTFQRHHLIELADLGTLFTERYQCPIPLGVIAIKKELSPVLLGQVGSSIEKSVRYAQEYPLSSRPYVLCHSQEKEENIVEEHIRSYVNQETIRISKDGLAAIRTLFELAIDQKLLSKEAREFELSPHFCHL